MSINAHELSNRLLNALDNNYNVVDMHTVNEIISILEKFNITKELLETTRLGKHVNELRRKTSDPQLARRAKVLVKRWRDLVIPTVASPGHTALPGSNRSSAERQVRRLGGTPLTSPALSRRVVSPAVPSPRPQSRPAWGGYESDSQDVILVDDDPSPPPAPSPLAGLHKPLIPSVKRPLSPQPLYDEKKAKRDKKPKKRRGHSRAGSGTEATSPLPNMGGITIPASPPPALPPPPAPLPPPTAPAPLPPAAWRDRNGTERRRNGKKNKLDPYTAMVNRMPTAGAKKVKTTKELLEEIQSRGSKPPASPGSPDVMLIEDNFPIKVESPLRNGGSPPPPASPPPPPAAREPLEEARAHRECTCGAAAEAACPAARRARVLPLHVRALHHAYLPGVNGTRAPLHPHQYAVRQLTQPARPDLFASVVPLYKYSDYADDRCAKNMSRVPLCAHLPWTEFAPPPPPSPPPPRPYPLDEQPQPASRDDTRDSSATDCSLEDAPVAPEMVGVPSLEPSERLKAPILSLDEETQFFAIEKPERMDVQEDFETEHQDHRTVERTKGELTGQQLYDEVQRTIDDIPYDYGQMSLPPVVTLPEEPEDAGPVLDEAFLRAEAETERLEFDRPPRPDNFAEWHECARLGELIALPYVVID